MGKARKAATFLNASILFPVDNEYDTIFAVFRMRHFHTSKQDTIDGLSRFSRYFPRRLSVLPCRD